MNALFDVAFVGSGSAGSSKAITGSPATTC